MPVFEIEAPNGKTYEVEGPNAAGAIEALKRTLGGGEPSPAMTDALAAGSQASQFFGGAREPNLADRAQSFAQGVINGLPVVGPGLEHLRVEADAALAQLPGGMTPEEVRANAAQRKAFLEEKAGNERLAGQVVGAVAPLTVAGFAAPATVGRALGMTGGLGSQMGLGALTGGAITGADTLARGGSLEDAGTSAMVGGGIGGAAPLVLKGVGAGLRAMTGQNAPKAAQNVAAALKADEIAVPGITRAMAQMGPDGALMDLGPNLQSLAGGIASVKGPGQKVLRDTIVSRAKAGPTRVAADIANTLGKGQELGALTEQIIAGQKAAADPLYAAVRNLPVPLEGNILFVSQTPMGKAAFERAAKLAANDGASGNGVTVGFLDYAKQALDDIAGAAKRSGENNTARQATQMARLLTSEVDKVVPQYKQARDAFAGPAAVLDAIEEGQATFTRNMSPADMSRLMANMTASEKDAFLQGAQTSIADMLGNSANDVASVRTLLRKPYNEAKMRALIGDGPTDELLKAIDRELVFGKTANAVEGNSETARRMAAQGMVNPEMASMQRPQDWMGLVFAAIDKARATLRATTQPKVNREMAELLASGPLSPAQLQQLGQASAGARPVPIAPAGLSVTQGQGKPLDIQTFNLSQPNWSFAVGR